MRSNTFPERELAMNEVITGMNKIELDTPCLIINKDVMEANLAHMANSVKNNLRPHIKTHKSPVIAKMQLAAGAIGITSAKVSEAEIMAKAGINNILIANQITGPRKITRLLDLASDYSIQVLVDNPVNVKELSSAAEARMIELHVLVELNVGLNRCGVLPGAPALE